MMLLIIPIHIFVLGLTLTLTQLSYAILAQQIEEAADGSCSICSRVGKPFLLTQNHPIPLQEAVAPEVTCGVVQQYAGQFSHDSDDCKSFMDSFENRCCDVSSFPQFYNCATSVRSTLLNGSYDVSVPPVQEIKNGTMRILEVEVLLVFISVGVLDVKTSTLEAFVSLELKWNDPRLKWNIDDENCATVVSMRADPSLEETEIWVPLLDLKNRALGTQQLTPTPAAVSHDGTVKWSRIGSLTAICSFTGLRRMPFDELGCQLHFGDNGAYTGLVDYKLFQQANTTTANGLQ